MRRKSSEKKQKAAPDASILLDNGSLPKNIDVRFRLFRVSWIFLDFFATGEHDSSSVVNESDSDREQNSGRGAQLLFLVSFVLNLALFHFPGERFDTSELHEKLYGVDIVHGNNTEHQFFLLKNDQTSCYPWWCRPSWCRPSWR